MNPESLDPLILQNDERHNTLKNIESTSEHQLLKQDEISEGIKDLNSTAEMLLLQGDEQKNQTFEIEANDANSLALWNLLRGPRGMKGDKGDKGDNAFHNIEEAIDNIKSDENFQALIKGEKGDKGEAGRDGVDGRDGLDGINGVDGQQGPMGIQGVQGERGPKGERGLKGPKGEPGRDGKDIDPKTVKEIMEKTDFAVKRASKTVSLVELDDVDLSQATISNGKYVIGGGGSGTVNTIVAGTGISVDSTDPANPVVTNTSPDQTVSITAGTNITSVTGTYPNFTINAATQVGGDMVLASIQTVTGAKTFNNAKFYLRNIADTFSGVFSNAITAARTWTLPDKDGTVAMTSDITGINSGTNTGDQTSIVGITGTIAQFNTACTDADFATGGGTATGTNTGDQTSIVGITGTKAQFDTAVTDGNIVYVSDSPTLGTITTTGNIELGNASDTTLSRSAAGVLAVEGVVVPTISSTNTLTNKRKQPRVYTAANNASLTPEIDTYDIFHLTAMSAATTINNHSTSTPADGELMEFRFLDNGTARALTWGSAYVAKAGVALPTTTVLSKNLTCLFEYNSNLSKWNLLASGQEA